MLLTCTSRQLAWTSTPSDRLDTTYKRLYHTAAIWNWEGGRGTRTFKIQTLKILLETNYRQLSVICILCYNHQGCHYGSCCHTICHLFKKLKLFSHQLNSKNKGQLLLFKNILLFGHWNCFLLSVAMDDKDAHGLNLENVGPTFSDLMPAKIISNWNLFGIFLSTCKSILYG